MECVPADRLAVDSDAVPTLRFDDPSRVGPSKNRIVPVAPEGNTVALSVTLCPNVDGLLFEATVVVVPAVLTVCVKTAEVLPLKLASPP
jgi:hypothetical protein